uniref:Aldo/keto reductase n=1 Tax=Caenorhabditis japonica TaxID=281687 RepID=A0A8R1IYU9_CAEJA
MVLSETIPLRTGYEMPKIGLGTWQISRSITALRVMEALELGYRHIDCAPGFRNMREAAQGVKDFFDAHPDVDVRFFYLVNK